jgi:hypothetical protein
VDNRTHEITKVVWDAETLEIVSRETAPYDGQWELCKGGNSQGQMNLADQQLNQQNQLMQQQLANQTTEMGMVNPTLQSIIQNGGMLPAQQAAMTTQAIQGLGQQYQNLQGQLGQQLAARGVTGGQMAGGGALAQGYGQLGAMEAGQESNLLNQIQLQKGQGLQSALGTAAGIGGMYGNQALGFGSQAGQALGSGVQAAGNADQAQTGFWGSLFGGLAGVGGSALGAAGKAGGFSSLFS